MRSDGREPFVTKCRAGGADPQHKTYSIPKLSQMADEYGAARQKSASNGSFVPATVGGVSNVSGNRLVCQSQRLQLYAALFIRATRVLFPLFIFRTRGFQIPGPDQYDSESVTEEIFESIAQTHSKSKIK